MIRKRLAAEEGQRKTFRATFSKFGKKINYKGYSEPTILLVNIVDAASNEVVADHVWFSLTKGFDSIKLEAGAVIEFEARIKEYKKGYVNKKIGINSRTKDYRLSHPTKISIVKT
jgi:hypothetical protein